MKKEAAGIKKYVTLMGNAVCALSILFVLAALVRTDFDFSQVTEWRLFVPVLMAGIVCKTVTVFMSASAWCLWLEFFAGKRCDRREALSVYAKANIGKYLPGNVMHYVERNLFAGKLELSQKQIAAASVSEIASLVLAAFFMGIFLAFSQTRDALAAVLRKLPFVQRLLEYPSGSGHAASENLPAGRIFCICIAAVILVVCVVFAVMAVRYCRRKWQYDFGSFLKTFLASFFIYAAVLVILGRILVWFYWYLDGRPSAGQALQITAAYIIAWVLGFVIPGAPGGIGVRETVLTLLLTPVTGRDSIVVLGVLHRLVTVAGDFAAYLLRIILLTQAGGCNHNKRKDRIQ